MPNLRSVIAQVHGKSRSIGSHRSFSTSSPTEVKVAEVNVAGFKIKLETSFTKSMFFGASVFCYYELYRFFKYSPELERRLEEEKLRLQRRE